MAPDAIQTLVRALESTTTRGEEDAWELLKPLGVSICPYLLTAYSTFKKSQGRVSLVFHAIRYARISEAAFQLGVLALNDRASLVRYRACSLLAYSLRKDALPYLKPLLANSDEKTAQDVEAAIDAIQSKNHHFFIDRGHSGSTHWVVNESDESY